MTDTQDWQPPQKIETLFEATGGNAFSGINRPTSGAREEKMLDVGDAPVQLYSLATPNGIKVSVLFEELIEAGCDFSYDAHLINIGQGDQFSSGFTEINPNGKIPACLDRDSLNGEEVALFESGSICLYFAEKYQRFIPSDPTLKAKMYNWIFWQMGSQGPMTGQFGHFFVYAPSNKHETREYGTARYGMETQRLCDVLDKALDQKEFLVGDELSLADLIVFPWFRQLKIGYPHDSGVRANDFLSIEKYRHAVAWSERLEARPGVERGIQVCDWKNPELGTKPWLKK